MGFVYENERLLPPRARPRPRVAVLALLVGRRSGRLEEKSEVLGPAVGTEGDEWPLLMGVRGCLEPVEANCELVMMPWKSSLCLTPRLGSAGSVSSLLS